MSYWTYYLAFMVLAYAARDPRLLAGIVLFLLLRRYIPDPGAVWRAMRRASSLRQQVAVNPANITARRDLALLYLDLLRPKRAVGLIEEALGRSPDDAELLYLHGLALHRAGRHEAALAPLVRAVDQDPRIRFGAPYLAAGDALYALGRDDEAIDAYERYADGNSSDVGVHTRLGRALARKGDHAAAKRAVHEAIQTWGVLRGGMRRRMFGRYLEAQWARVTVLHEPLAIAAVLAITAGAALAARAAYPVMRNALATWGAATSATFVPPVAPGADRGLYDAFARCGSQTTGDFVGKYVVEVERAPGTGEPSPTASPRERDARARLYRGQYDNFEVQRDRIRCGTETVAEFCLTRTIERTPDALRAEAVWHEDVDDPGDASVVEIRLERQGDGYRFAYGQPGASPATAWIPLRRAD